MQNFVLGLLLTLNHVQAFFNLSSVKYCINTPLFNSLNAGKLCMLLLPSADLSFKIIFSKVSFRNKISVKQFGSRSGPTFCLS